MKETGKERTGRPKPMTINARQRTRIGYWNVQTLLETSLRAQADKGMNSYILGILGLSETSWP